MSEIIENAYITDYHLEFKEGKLTLHIGLDGKGWGCYYSGELQGTKPIFDLLDALKIHELDELNDVALVRVRHNGVGSKITAIGDIVEDRWFSFPAPETSACEGDCKNCDNPPLTVADLYKLYEDPDNDGHVWISLDGCIFLPFSMCIPWTGRAPLSPYGAPLRKRKAGCGRRTTAPRGLHTRKNRWWTVPERPVRDSYSFTAKEMEEHIAHLKALASQDPSRAKALSIAALIRIGVLEEDGTPKDTIVSK